MRVVSLLVTLVVLGVGVWGYLAHYPYFEKFDDRIVDGYFSLRGTQQASKDIVIVDIDEKSLEELGQWPWSRNVLATILRHLTDAGAAIVGWDILFAEPDRTSPHRLLAKSFGNLPNYDLIFAQAIANSPSILGYAFDFERKNERFFTVASTIVEHGKRRESIPVAKGVVLNIDPIQQSAYSSGFFNMIPDSDGVVRSVPMLIRYEGFLYPSLTLEIFRTLLQSPKIEVYYDNVGVDLLALGNDLIKTDLHGRLIINFRAGAKAYPYVSAVDVYKGTFKKEQIEGKIVFIGTSATGLLDLRATPLENAMPGVEIHANILDNLLKGDYLVRPSWLPMAQVLTLVVVALLLFFVFWLLRPLYAIVFSLLIVVGIWASGYYLFAFHRVITEPFIPLSVAIALGFLQTGIHFYFEHRQKELVKEKFAAKVSRSVAEELIKNPQQYLSVQEREVTLFFSDIRNFTDLSEQIGDPKELALWLNRYLTPMSEIILQLQGTLDKFIGDAIMAYWNAPLKVADHPDKALQSALMQLQKIKELNVALRKDGLPSISVGMGLHIDRVIVGELGSRLRSDYTAIGEGVNLASRLEGLNKQYGTKIIISKALYERLKGSYNIRYLDRVQVKGMQKSVEIFEVSLEPFKELDAYMKAQDLYQAGRFKEAEKIFEKIWHECQDEVSRMFKERCRTLQNEGEGFDGVYRFETK